MTPGGGQHKRTVGSLLRLLNEWLLVYKRRTYNHHPSPYYYSEIKSICELYSNQNIFTSQIELRAESFLALPSLSLPSLKLKSVVNSVMMMLLPLGPPFVSLAPYNREDSRFSGEADQKLNLDKTVGLYIVEWRKIHI